MFIYKGKQRVCVRARALSRIPCSMFALPNTRKKFCVRTHPYISAYICPLSLAHAPARAHAAANSFAPCPAG